MPYEVPPLPYDYNALEPHIDEQTMRLHHDKHHQTYVDKANAALEGTEWAERPVEEVLRALDELPEDKRAVVRNNGGGHYNHTLFWEMMSPEGGEPSGEIAEALDRTFGGLDAFKEQFSTAATNHFGSGWAWLVWDGASLRVATTVNQDAPVMEGQTPILGLDVWEHAYYLRYQNRRPEYIQAWWNVVNWEKVAERLAGAREGATARA
jgi:superoxide dismutase, Fe-Mn family